MALLFDDENLATIAAHPALLYESNSKYSDKLSLACSADLCATIHPPISNHEFISLETAYTKSDIVSQIHTAVVSSIASRMIGESYLARRPRAPSTMPATRLGTAALHRHVKKVNSVVVAMTSPSSGHAHGEDDLLPCG